MIPPGLSLAALSVLATAGMLWVYVRTSDQAAIRRTKRALRASLYELRLFTDEPALIWRAQVRLWRDSLVYFGLLVRPMLLLAVPMALVLAGMDWLYGSRPLAAGETAIVTARLAQPLDVNAPPPSLEAPAGVVVETPPVRVPARRELSWRIRAVSRFSGTPRVAGRETERVEVRYPPAEVRLLGIGFHWLVWFIVLSTLAAWVMVKRFRIE